MISPIIHRFPRHPSTNVERLLRYRYARLSAKEGAALYDRVVTGLAIKTELLRGGPSHTARWIYERAQAERHYQSHLAAQQAPPADPEPNADREQLTAFAVALAIVLAFLALALIQPAACQVAGADIPALCAD